MINDKTTTESGASDLDIDLMNRKLTDVYMTVPIAVPWFEFERYVDEVFDTLYSNGLHISKIEIMNNPEIRTQCEYRMRGFLTEMLDGWGDTHEYAEEDSEKIYSAEIKKQHLAEQAEAKRRAAELEIEARAVDAAIIVPKKYNSKARAILKAAGYIS